jgi:hypothetical protein
MRGDRGWIGIAAAALACALPCIGCGGSLHDAPSNPLQGPILTQSKLKQKADFEARAKAKPQGRARPVGPGRKGLPAGRP